MPSAEMNCYLVTKSDDAKPTAAPARRPLSDLPAGDVLVRVAWSSLNYKDALAASGHPGVVRRFPHVPGIDAAGNVEESSSNKFRPGDRVLITGFEMGAPAWGGWAEYVRVPAGWLVPLPTELSFRESMIFGTAGFTAAQSIEQLQHNEITPDRGMVVVTGSTGGVGSLAVAILARLGYRVAAVTGKTDSHEWLRSLGAEEILGREVVNDTSTRPLLSARWVGAVDTVGGNTLATVIRSTDRHGCVTACGLVGGTDLELSVHPFILRGVRLVGIDSATWDIDRRPPLWDKMAGPWRPGALESLVDDTVELDGLDAVVKKILAGRVRGRVLVRVGGDD
ncbi:MAG: YhdH/YhfP family quinone oxidoreductase [Pirellulales bacterium]|nr:YhdH/YhfP family quinone oxidoreductase [Pirellulales bacterium]